jgi:class 3 adenylate cyclase/quercetin dioxygenase-like cupin family protein
MDWAVRVRAEVHAVSADKPTVLQPGEGQLVGPGNVVVKAADHGAGGDFLILEGTLEPGLELPLHRHRRTHEAFYVLEGEVDFHIGNERGRGGPGTFFHVPPEVDHGVTNAGPSPARLLSLHIPGREYLEFMKDMAEAIPERATSLDERRISAIFDRYDFEILGPRRLIATVMIVDIVDSTAHVARLGDRKWRDLLDRYFQVVRDQLARYGGREIKTMGDGVLTMFERPNRAIRCAIAVAEAAGELGLEARVGLHSGECELTDDDLRGLTVHIGARVAALAGPGEVLVSGTVRDLLIGSANVTFVDRKVRTLKGVPGRWHLFAVGRGSDR